MRVLTTALLLAGVCSSGCAIVPHVGIFYTDVRTSHRVMPLHQDTRVMPKNYEILGRTSAENVIVNYLGWIAMGSDGVDELYHQALSKVPGANLLVDVHLDHHTKRIFTFYIQRTTTLEGLAVKAHVPEDPRAAGDPAGDAK